MSTNNQLIIVKHLKHYKVFENMCVDNEFEFEEEIPIKICNTLKEAIKFANKYCRENVVEYGYYITDNCLK